jgi:hypothetical protein
MKFISHRGNTNGINKEEENKPSYILKALEDGYDCEIDVWLISNNLYLGHDEPQWKISSDFLENDNLWCHAKNINALYYMMNNKKIINCFWHQNDDFTITKGGYIWTFPKKELTNISICVLPELNYHKCNIKNCFGICSDFIKKYKY